MKTRVARIAQVEPGLTGQCHALYSKYYEGSSETYFRSDFKKKDLILLLSNSDGALCGFSTLAVFPFESANGPCRILFSGDTIIEHRHWGNLAFPRAWAFLAGQFALPSPAGTKSFTLLRLHTSLAICGGFPHTWIIALSY